jgi:hypothetical protein
MYVGEWSRAIEAKVCKINFLCIAFAGIWIHDNFFYYLKTPSKKKKTSILKVLLKQYKSPTGHTKFKHATNINIQVFK